MPGIEDRTRRETVFAALGAVATLSACASTTERGPMPAPFKCTSFIRRAASLSPDAFLSMWERDRAPILRELPGVIGLAFNVVDRARSPDTTYDAAIEMWFEDETAYSRAVSEAPASITSALADNIAHFMQPDALTLFTRETTIRALAPGRLAPRAKRIGLVGRKPDMSQSQFFHDWTSEHAPPVDLQPGLERYVLNLLTRARAIDSPWDGYAELWWTDWEAYERGRAYIRARNDLNQRLGFFHAHQLLLVEEHVVIEPPWAEHD